MPYAHPLHRFRPALWFAALALLLVGIEHFVTRQPAFGQHRALPLAVLFDVLVGLPALFYILVVRRYQWPPNTVLAAVGAGLALSHWLIPAAQLPPLQVLRWLPAGLELMTLGLLLTRARRLWRAYHTAVLVETGFLSRIRTAVAQQMGPTGQLLLAEIDMLRFAVAGWWARPAAHPNATAFSSHRESGFVALVVVGCLGLLIETAALHLLAHHWSPTLANWLLLFEVYGLLLLLAHGHAVRLQPTLLTAGEVLVRVGFCWRVVVPRAALVAVEPLRGDLQPDSETHNLAKLLFTAPNLLLTFAESITLTGPYGIRRSARRVAIYLDQPRQFIAAAGFSS